MSKNPLFFVIELKSSERKTENEWPYIEGYSKKEILIYDFSTEKIITSDLLLNKDSDVIRTLSKILAEQVERLVKKIKKNADALFSKRELPEDIKEEALDVVGFLKLLKDIDEMIASPSFNGILPCTQTSKAKLVINFLGDDYVLVSKRGAHTVVPSDGVVSLGRNGGLVVNNKEEVDELTFVSKYLEPIIKKWTSKYRISTVEVLVPKQVFKQLVNKGLKMILFLKRRIIVFFRPKNT